MKIFLSGLHCKILVATFSSLFLLPLLAQASDKNLRVDGPFLDQPMAYVTALHLGGDGKTLFFNAQRGLYRLDSDSRNAVIVGGADTPLQVHLFQLSRDSKTLFIGTYRGLYRLDSGSKSVTSVKGLEPFSSVKGTNPGPVVNAFQLSEDGKTLFVGTMTGLYRLDSYDKSAVLVDGTDSSTQVQLLQLSGDSKTLFIGTKKGLYRLDLNSKSAVPVRGIDRALDVQLLKLSGDGKTLFIGMSNNLYRIDFRSNVAVPVKGINPNKYLPNNNALALQLGSDGKTLFIGTRVGLYRLDPGNKSAVLLTGVPISDVTALQLSGDGKALFCGTDTGIYRLDHEEKVAASVGDIDAMFGSFVFQLSRDRKTLFIGAEDGVYRLDSGSKLAVRVEGIEALPFTNRSKDILNVTAFQLSEDGNTLFIATYDGLFRLNIGGTWAPIIIFKNEWPEHHFENVPDQDKAEIRWTIENYDWHATPATIRQTIRVSVDSKRLTDINVPQMNRNDEDEFYCDVPLSKPGTYRFTVMVTDIMGNPPVASSTETLQVTGKPKWQATLEQTAVVVFILDMLAFIVLVLAARSSRNAFDILVNNQVTRLPFLYLGYL